MITRTGFAALLASAVLGGGSAAAAAQETVLYSFRGGQDGHAPGLIIGANGVLYGTTAGGSRIVFGTVFALSLPLADETR